VNLAYSAAAKIASRITTCWVRIPHTSYSTLLHALGVDLKVQQELLRHPDIRTTMNTYTQAVPVALREANSKVVWCCQRKSPDVNGPSWPLKNLQAIIQKGDVGRGGGDRKDNPKNKAYALYALQLTTPSNRNKGNKA